MTFFLIHGTFGSPKEAWFPWLKQELEALGHRVLVPQFPTDSWDEVSKLSPEHYVTTQGLSAWTKVFEEHMNTLGEGEKICFVGHSLGPMFILHMVEHYGLSVQSSYFVAPFLHPATEEELKDAGAALIHIANLSFYYHDFDFEALRRYIPHSTVIYSDDDPNVHEWEALEFAEKLGSKSIQLHGLGHMGIESHLTMFPQLLDAIKQDNL